MPVPVWVIILAVLAGLLLLAVLVFVMYRVSTVFEVLILFSILVMLLFQLVPAACRNTLVP